MKTTQPNSGSGNRYPAEGETILAEGVSYPFNDYLSGCNDNVLVVGGSGTGKTRSIVRPNLLQAAGSYIVSDPKGNLYDQYASYLRARGYRVERLDFVQPLRSTVYYNPFQYLENETDVYKMAHRLNSVKSNTGGDMFWEYSSVLLLEAVIAYLRETRMRGGQTLAETLAMIRQARRSEVGASGEFSLLDKLLTAYAKEHPDSQAARCYESLRIAPIRTWDSICITASAKYGVYDTRELRWLMHKDTLVMQKIGDQPTAIFVVVSDTDRSMDALANIFFSQAMQVLCHTADAREDSRLPIPVRFILDDFATNVRIDEFPRMISSIRSRGISAMLMIQAESQLRSGYGEDAETIIGNCDTYVYLGGNDVETARRIGERCDLPMQEILYAPIGEALVFRRGQRPGHAGIFRLDSFEAERMEPMRNMMAATTEPKGIGERLELKERREERKHRRNNEAGYGSGLPIAYIRNRKFAG